jgi:dihydrofolate reductase
MRKIIAGYASSLDGYIEGPNGEYDWILIDKEIDFSAYFSRFDTFFFGRKTYEMVRQMGSNSFPGVKSYVFSKTLTEVEEPYILINGNVKEKVTRLKNEPGKDIAVYGGASLLASLLDDNLIDEITTSIIPVLLGEGKPMVAVLKNKVSLSLLDIKKYSNGTLQVTYKVQ